MRTRRRGDPQGLRQESQDATDGATANAGRSKESERQPYHIDLGQNGYGLRLALKLTQARLGFFEGLHGLVSLRFDSRQLLAQVTILVAALFGFALPLLSTVFDFRKLTHGACLHLAPWQVATGEVVG